MDKLPFRRRGYVGSRREPGLPWHSARKPCGPCYRIKEHNVKARRKRPQMRATCKHCRRYLFGLSFKRTL